MKSNKINILVDNIQKDLTGMKIEEIEIKDIRTIKQDLIQVKERMIELEAVVDAYILVLG